MTEMAVTLLHPRAARSSSAREFPGGFTVVAIVLSLAVLALVLYPLGVMLVRLIADFDPSVWAGVFGSAWFGGMVRDTLIVVGGVSSVVALGVALLLAWINERTDAGFGTVGDSLPPLVPLFLPTVAMAIGWAVLASPPDVGFLNGAVSAILDPFGISHR